MNTEYFTKDFNTLSDQRKIEELVAALTRIVFMNDCDTESTMNLLEQIAELRQSVRA